MAAIERILVRRLTRLFGSTAALKAVDVSFDAGTISFLEGPNGAGKSTLLNVVGTVLRPTRGSVEYAPLGEDLAAVRHHIGWLAHDSHCYRELSGSENVRLAASLYGAGSADVERALERVGSGPFRDRSFGTLSRGQRQRIALARAIVHEPSVLLLDEPWSGLDAASAERLELIVAEERARGALVICVSHALEHAERLKARRVRLEAGRIVSDSTPPAS